MKARLVLALLLVALLATAVSACGGGDDGDAAVEDLASVAPPASPLYVEMAVRPQGQLQANVEALAADVAGIDDLGGLVVETLEEEAAESDEPLDYETDVEPWLGERAGISFDSFDGEDFHGFALAVQTTDADAAQAFIDKFAKEDGEPFEEGSYEGYEFRKSPTEGQLVGMLDNLLLVAEDEASFEAAVDASGGESLSDSEVFQEAVAALSDGSFADLYLDVGAMIRQSGGEVDPQARQLLKTAGINPDDFTLTASLVPGADFVELDVASDLGGAEAPSSDASQLLGSLPANSVVALASAGFGDQLQEGIDELDRSGVPGEVPPRQLKNTLSAVGIDLDRIAGSLQDAGFFLQGSREANLGGALVLTSDGGEAKETVTRIGRFLRVADVPGVTAVGGRATGFSVRDPELGRQPLVVAAEDERIAIAYGTRPALQALGVSNTATLSDNATYEEAVAALEGTPITGFVDGPSALRLAQSFVPKEDEAEFRAARPYLRKASYLAIGSGSSDGLATAKLILGFRK